MVDYNTMLMALSCGSIALDVVSGFIAAFATCSFRSSKMREGLYHQCGTALFLVLGAYLQYASCYLPFEFELQMPIYAAVCLYVIVMNVGSVCENLGRINPELLHVPIFGVIARCMDEFEDSK